MHKQSFTEYSAHLGRDMSFNVYGSGGKPVLVVPCQNGRYFDWEGFGMLAFELLAQPDIDGGLIGGASLVPEKFVKIIEAANQPTA